MIKWRHNQRAEHETQSGDLEAVLPGQLRSPGRLQGSGFIGPGSQHPSKVKSTWDRIQWNECRLWNLQTSSGSQMGSLSGWISCLTLILVAKWEEPWRGVWSPKWRSQSISARLPSLSSFPSSWSLWTWPYLEVGSLQMLSTQGSLLRWTVVSHWIRTQPLPAIFYNLILT